jgi:signal transduction histidine kinase
MGNHAFDQPGRTPEQNPDGAADAVLRQAQQVEALGAMAAEVAHEFNNLLTVVLGSLEQLRRQPLDERGRRQLERAEWSARQAGRLTRQMLSFASGAIHEDRVVDVNAVVGEFDRMLGQAAGKGIRLAIATAPGPLPVRLDAGQLELALLNLVRNAAHAMAGKGQVVVRTAAHGVNGLGGRPTVTVSVSDTGTGMPPAVLQQVRARFFTTKDRSQGTGLGLWIVQRFVTAAGGTLEIDTATAQGTTIHLVFPRALDGCQRRREDASAGRSKNASRAQPS